MEQMQIFENKQFGAIRTVKDENGEPWFVGKDVASVLGYSNTMDALSKHVDADDKQTSQIAMLGQSRKMTIINESGLYSLILSSKLPQAREFKHWVTSEVLPQIRKTGGYIPLTPSSSPRGEMEDAEILLRALLIVQKNIELKNGLLEAQKPKVMFADAVTSCDDSILIRDLAKLITQNGVNIGQARLFYWLRLHGYLFKRETRPIQKWVEQGLFDTTITLIPTRGGIKECCTTKVTGLGQAYFVNGFLSGRFCAENGKFDAQ